MGCGQAKAAKVEDTYAIPECTESDTNLDEPEKTVSESVQEIITDKSQKIKSTSIKSSKSDKDDSDWVPTIDTDIFNVTGGGRIETEEVVKEDANEQTLV